MKCQFLLSQLLPYPVHISFGGLYPTHRVPIAPFGTSHVQAIAHSGIIQKGIKGPQKEREKSMLLKIETMCRVKISSRKCVFEYLAAIVARIYIAAAFGLWI